MTALTKNEGRSYSDGEIIAGVPVDASSKIFQGSLLEISSAGNVKPATKAANKTYFGVSLDEADNSSGKAGDLTVRVRLRGMFRFKKTGTAARGKDAYVADDNTVTDVATGASKCGRIVDVRGDDVMVYLYE